MMLDSRNIPDFGQTWSNNNLLGSSTFFWSITVEIYLAWAEHGRAHLFRSSTVKTSRVLAELGQNIPNFGRDCPNTPILVKTFKTVSSIVSCPGS